MNGLAWCCCYYCYYYYYYFYYYMQQLSSMLELFGCKCFGSSNYQRQKEYFYYHMDGLWWWEVGYEWWYFDEARPTAQKLVVVLCLECIAGLLSLGRRVGRSRLGAWGQWQACDVWRIGQAEPGTGPSLPPGTRGNVILKLNKFKP